MTSEIESSQARTQKLEGLGTRKPLTQARSPPHLMFDVIWDESSASILSPATRRR
jgi:hypothetical protein